MPRITGAHLDFFVEDVGQGEPLLLLHGFTGSAESWQWLIPRLAREYRVLAVDLPGHGRTGSPRDWGRYGFSPLVEDLTLLLNRVGVGRCHLLGYSLGGRVALHLALAAPERIQTLILESSSPGIADPRERQARIRSDEALAERIEREGIAGFTDFWERLPLWESQNRLPPALLSEQRRQRLANDPAGLAGSLRALGTGRMDNLRPLLSGFDRPVLLIAGAEDAKYLGLSAEMAGLLPRSRRVVVPEAGHNVHLEAPAAFLRLLLDFLRQHPLSGAETTR